MAECSQSRHWLKVSVQLYAPGSLSKERDAVAIGYEPGVLQNRSMEKGKVCATFRNRSPIISP